MIVAKLPNTGLLRPESLPLLAGVSRVMQGAQYGDGFVGEALNW